jgi:hypothetical protein
MSMEPQETNMYGKPNTYRLEGVGELETSVLKKRSHNGAKQTTRVCLTSVTMLMYTSALHVRKYRVFCSVTDSPQY